MKTLENDGSVADFLKRVEEAKRKDCQELVKIMKRVTGKNPKMWGDSIVGFDKYHYVYASGREGDWPITGFSPRKQSLTIYIMNGFKDYSKELKKLGKYKTSVSCLYVKRLEDIDTKILEKIITKSVKTMRSLY